MIIVVAVLLAYANSFSGPFIFDDEDTIVNNPTIRHLSPLSGVLMPPATDETVSGRPLLNLSFALNYALGGESVQGYHMVNLAIHILAALVLFEIVRRTLERPVVSARFGSAALPLALVIALLWAVHPLQTESVTYLSQRAESLLGLFYLLTIYCFIRGAESKSSRIWYPLSVTACLLGVFTKEVIVSAPLLALLYDRTFIAGNFADAWRRRGRIYAALFGTWLPLGWIVATDRGPQELSLLGTGKGFGMAALSPGLKIWAYALKQCEAIVHYLQLVFWPRPLVFDYGMDVVTDPRSVAPQIIVLALLGAGTIYALWRKPVLGFLGLWFFAILAPSSSLLPITEQTMAEHRMYLPLAAVLALTVLGFYALAGRRALIAGFVVAAGFIGVSVRRNETYRSAEAIWADTAAKRGDQPRAHDNLGAIYAEQEKFPEAIGEFQRALQIKPDYAEARYNLGAALLESGDPAAAIAQLRSALEVLPNPAPAHNLIGEALAQQNQPDAAVKEYQAALAIAPDFFQAYFNLGNALDKLNRYDEAVAAYRAALKLDATNATLHNNLAVALLQQGNFAGAQHEFAEALRLQPDYAAARDHLDKLNALLKSLAPGKS